MMTGRIVSGKLEVGMKVCARQNTAQFIIGEIEMHKNCYSVEGTAGDYVSFTCKSGPGPYFPRTPTRFIVSDPNNDPERAAEKFIG